jgi:hypothetical protein
MKRVYYVVCPGWIESKNDGQRHFIGAMQLMNLYGLNTRRHDVHIEPSASWEFHGWNPPTDAVYLRPRYHGDYTEQPVYETDTRN